MLRHFSFIGILALLLTLLEPLSASAQRPYRWLADPQLLGHVKQVGPTGGVQTGNTIFDMKLLNATTGWAASYHGLLRFDGRYWQLPDTSNISKRALPVSTVTALDFIDASNGWAIGTTQGSGPPRVDLYRYDGANWRNASDVVRKDGTIGGLYGSMTDIALSADGVGWAIGMAYNVGLDGTSSGQRSLLLQLRGDTWHDVTPDNWQNMNLTALSITNGGNAWIGATRMPTAGEPARSIMLVYSFGAWVEQPLPDLSTSPQPFSIRSIYMRDATEGWAIFTDAGTRCAFSRLLHYKDNTWTLIPAEAHNRQEIIALGLVPGTSRGWATIADCNGRSVPGPHRRMRFDSGTFTPDSGGSPLAPRIYALLNDEVQWSAVGGSPMRYTAEALPTERISAAPRDARYFTTTGHSLSGAFKRYYETHGLELGERGVSDRESLALFGYPISEPFTDINPDTGDVLTVQYFERARMEWHPKNPEPYKVLLGRIGASTAITRFGGITRPLGNVPPTPTECSNFIETGFDLCPPLRSFWERNGGLAVYGIPITAARDEQSATDGKTYLTQWFERERLEHHPENRGTPYEVLLGLLGAEDLRVRGYLP